MSRVTLQPLCLVLTSNLVGEADFSLKVPGTFAGLTDDKPGRFFKAAKIWTDAGSNGDKIFDLRLEDTDGILTALNGAGQFPVPSTVFPSYPIILSFQDDDITETSTLKKGFFLAPIEPLLIEKIDPREVYDFMPAGFYLMGTFKTANAVLLGQKVRINIFWGKLT